MPLVKVEILKGKTMEYKKALLDGIHLALVEAFKIPDDDKMHRLYELEKENFQTVPRMKSNATIIELTVFKGRSVETKKYLYSEIVSNLEKSPGINRDEVLIVLNEVSMENWGIRGGKIASEVNLGFDINV